MNPPLQSNEETNRKRSYNEANFESSPAARDELLDIEITKHQILDKYCQNCDFKKNLAAVFCESCNVAFCSECDASIHRSFVMQRHKRIAYKVEMFCLRHSVMLTHWCLSCTGKDEDHDAHTVQPIHSEYDMVYQLAQSAKESLVRIDAQLKSISSAVESLSILWKIRVPKKDTITCDKGQAIAVVTEHFDYLQHVLLTRRDCLINLMHEMDEGDDENHLRFSYEQLCDEVSKGIDIISELLASSACHIKDRQTDENISEPLVLLSFLREYSAAEDVVVNSFRASDRLCDLQESMEELKSRVHAIFCGGDLEKSICEYGEIHSSDFEVPAVEFISCGLKSGHVQVQWVCDMTNCDKDCEIPSCSRSVESDVFESEKTGNDKDLSRKSLVGFQLQVMMAEEDVFDCMSTLEDKDGEMISYCKLLSRDSCVQTGGDGNSFVTMLPLDHIISAKCCNLTLKLRVVVLPGPYASGSELDAAEIHSNRECSYSSWSKEVSVRIRRLGSSTKRTPRTRQTVSPVRSDLNRRPRSNQLTLEPLLPGDVSVVYGGYVKSEDDQQDNSIMSYASCSALSSAPNEDTWYYPMTVPYHSACHNIQIIVEGAGVSGLNGMYSMYPFPVVLDSSQQKALTDYYRRDVRDTPIYWKRGQYSGKNVYFCICCTNVEWEPSHGKAWFIAIIDCMRTDRKDADVDIDFYWTPISEGRRRKSVASRMVPPSNAKWRAYDHLYNPAPTVSIIKNQH